MSKQVYAGVDKDNKGGLTHLGRMVRDAWVFGILPETETCEGWDAAQMQNLYEQVYAQMTLDAPQPDLVIYLQAPVEVLLARIAKRGLASERFIETAYLQRLVDAYTHFFYHYTAAPLLIVNATEINPINNDQDYELLLERVRNVRNGRHYFNPMAIAL